MQTCLVGWDLWGGLGVWGLRLCLPFWGEVLSMPSGPLSPPQFYSQCSTYSVLPSGAVSQILPLGARGLLFCPQPLGPAELGSMLPGAGFLPCSEPGTVQET